MRAIETLGLVVFLGTGGVGCVGDMGEGNDPVTESAEVGLDGYPEQDPDGFIRVEPFRFLDTRESERFGAGSTACWAVGGIPENATAVAINLTAVKPQGSGYLTAYPYDASDDSVPSVSSVNYAAGQNVGNGLIVPLGDAGKICVFTYASSHVVLDVNGFFANDSAFTPVKPYRRVDTRQTSPVTAGSTRCWKLAGADDKGLPQDDVPDGAVAVAVNVVAIRPEARGFLTAFPYRAGDNTAPETSSLNYAEGAVVANGAIVTVGDGNQVCVRASATTHLVIDVYGYFGADATYTPIAAERAVDTRGPKGDRRQPAGGSTRCVKVAGRFGVPASANAVVVNLAAVRALEPGFLRVRPAGEADIATSTVNYAVDETRANNAIVKPGAHGEICVYARTQVHYVLDVVGYWPGSLDPDPIAHPHIFAVDDAAGLIGALEQAVGGDTVEVAANAIVDLSGNRDIPIPGDVTIRGGRGGGEMGALLFTSDEGIVPAYKTWSLFKTAGDGVTVRDLRLRGPDGTVSPGFMANGISARHDDFLLENIELYNWPDSGVYTGGTANAVIDGNYIHDNIRVGRGYGVVVGRTETPTRIVNNVFRHNRHSVAGSGHGSYEVAYNLFAPSDSHGVHPLVDMHGVNEHTLDNSTEQAGIEIYVHHNDFQYAGTLASLIDIRGIPVKEAVIEDNCVARTDWQWVRQSNMLAYPSPQAGQACYEKSGTWLCHYPTYGWKMENILVQDNAMGTPTGCR